MYFVSHPRRPRRRVPEAAGGARRGGVSRLWSTDYLDTPPAEPPVAARGRRAAARVSRRRTGAVAGARGSSSWRSLERARLELFDGPDAEPLTLEALRARPPDRVRRPPPAARPQSRAARHPLRRLRALAHGRSLRYDHPRAQGGHADRLAPRQRRLSPRRRHRGGAWLGVSPRRPTSPSRRSAPRWQPAAPTREAAAHAFELLVVGARSLDRRQVSCAQVLMPRGPSVPPC